MHCSVFIATSLDGFIADADGGIGWLLAAQQQAPADEDFGYAAFFAQQDALLMGRNTYDQVRDFSPWPYGTTPVFLASRRPLEPSSAQAAIEQVCGNCHDLLAPLAARGFERVYLDGGQLIQQFLAEGRVQDLIITQIPVLLGQGIRLFGPLAEPSAWRLINSRAFSCGFVQQHYQPAH